MKHYILIIDENKSIRSLLSTILNSISRTILQSDCFSAALTMRKEAVDMIILNIDDLHSDNYDFLMHLNSSRLFSTIPKIIISGNTSPELKVHCLNSGVHAFFQKPFDPLVISEIARKTLDVRPYAQLV